MAGEFFSASWYRVERLKPRLRSHVDLTRHQYRGRTWYVLQDRASERFHRFTPAAYHLIGLMDGRHTVRTMWESATSTLGYDAPSQDEVIHLLAQLHSSDLIVCDVLPDTGELTERADRIARRRWASRLSNLFAWRRPLCDPDRFLTALLPVVRPLVSSPGLTLWLCLASAGLALGGLHWPDLTHDLLAQLTTPHSLLVLWLLFPLVKLVHELGHGFMTKAFGGEVHELGVMLLVFTPVPYCEASAAWAFRDKWQRVLVGAAGMMVEVALASLALVVWINAEPGLVRLLAYNTILLAGVSTVLFNLNPLLRFDGYYMLMDWLEIPNLRARAAAYVRYLCERYLFGAREVSRPDATAGERAWFVGYGVASTIYRLLVTVAILLFLGELSPLLGVLFAGMTAVGMLVVPLVKGFSYLFTSPSLRLVRGRAFTVTAVVFSLLAGGLSLASAPFHTLAEGVVWVPDESVVRAGTDGFVLKVVAESGSLVQPDDVLFVAEHPRLQAEARVLAARMKELQARHAEQRPVDLVKAAIIEEELVYVRDQLARMQRRLDDLIVRSRAAGQFVLPAPQDLPGRFVKQGEVLAHVVDRRRLTVRTVVPQADIDLVRTDGIGVEVRLAEQVRARHRADVVRLAPSAVTELPHAALGTEGGGSVPVDPTDTEGVRTVERMFQVDLVVPDEAGLIHAGERVHIRFSHGWAPLAEQWYRQVRQLFLARFNV
ncbi:MAG: HlyD family efflux transporter periplasmic adaptor subunit [Nitrospira sp. CR2.1]|nr:HlyD family efflux transporter periplasmic adaptor subunit [Nitrospira sp. CR2.1]